MFITDFGESFNALVGTESVMKVSRYGVWGDKRRAKPEVLECSDDLEYLQKKYGPNLKVITLSGK